MEAAQFLMDDVYARRCDLEGSNGIFAADLLYHRNSYPGYIFKYNTAKKESRNPIKDKETVKGKRLVFKNYVDQITNIGITNIRITNIRITNRYVIFRYP